MVELTADVARDLLEYDLATGELRWKPRDRVAARKAAEISAGYHPNHGRAA